MIKFSEIDDDEGIQVEISLNQIKSVYVVLFTTAKSGAYWNIYIKKIIK